jgi:hypothetical protein
MRPIIINGQWPNDRPSIRQAMSVALAAVKDRIFE